MLRHQGPHCSTRQASRLGNASHLILGRGRADVRIEAAAEDVTRSMGTSAVLPGRRGGEPEYGLLWLEKRGIGGSQLEAVELAPL